MARAETALSSRASNLEAESNRPEVLVRIGGLPIESLRNFESPLCLGALARVDRFEERLDSLRFEAAEALGQAVPGSERSIRRILLKVRRDCHNARSLAKYEHLDLWTERPELADHLRGILEAEQDLESAHEAFRSTYETEAEREYEAVSELLEDRRFLHGLAFSSPSMAAQLDRLCKSPRDYGRRERRLASSLLRYASRAAFKLSPNSTLTRVTWARLHDDAPETRRLTLPAPPWKESSTFRFQRAALDQLSALLRANPAITQPSTELVLNTSLGSAVDGMISVLRPAAWLTDSEGNMRYRPSTVVRVDADTPFLAWCREALRDGARSVEELTTALAEYLGGDLDRDLADELSALLERFTAIGVLERLRPWCVPGRHPEAELAEYFGDAPHGSTAEGVGGALKALVDLEHEGERNDAEPVDLDLSSRGSARRIGLASRALAHFESAWRQGDAVGDTRRYETRDRDLSETVVLSAKDAAAGEPLVSLSRHTARRLVEQLRPWAEILSLHGHRVEMLITLAAQLRRSAPGRARMPVLRAFEQARPLWRSYRQTARLHRMGSAAWTEVFNPLALEAIDRIETSKRRIFGSLLELSDERGEPGPGRPLETIQLERAALEELARSIPTAYRSPFGPCLQLQPADAAASAWVMNRFFEGTGRYGSRFSVFMDPGPRRLYLDHMIERSTIEHDGETHHVLDLLCSNSHELNARHIQTREVLLLPGEGFSAPRPVGIPLRDLACEFDASSPLPRLVGPDGKRYVPVHLGGMTLENMPTIVQFLALFGPGESLSPRPPVRARLRENHTVSPRLDLGDITVRRAQWSFETHVDVARAIARSSGHEAFEAVQRLRGLWGLPQRVFVLERVSERGYKPQFLDLSSPLYVEIFRTTIRAQDAVTLVEALPDIGDHPRSADGTAWALEVQLDDRALWD